MHTDFPPSVELREAGSRDTRRLFVLLAALVVAAAGAVTVAAWLFFVPAARQLETGAAIDELVVCQAMISDHLARLRATALDWANWDDLQRHALRPSTAFREENFTPPALRNLGLHGVALFDAGGRLVDHLFEDEAKFAECTPQCVTEATAALRARSMATGDAEAAPVIFRNVVMLAGTAPVHGSNLAPPSAGQLVFLRLLTDGHFGLEAQKRGIRATLIPPEVEVIRPGPRSRAAADRVVATQALPGLEGDVARIEVTREAGHVILAREAFFRTAFAALVVSLILIALGHGALVRLRS
jgi:sensor domain CHASE-containing protein